jgi:uncharacterized protein (TIGR00251 family)
MEVANAIRALAPEKGGGVSILVRAQPRASRSAVVGTLETPAGVALKIAITAPPVEGAANAAIVELLADKLGVPKRSVVIARGESGREKQVHVHGITAAEAIARLSP